MKQLKTSKSLKFDVGFHCSTTISHFLPRMINNAWAQGQTLAQFSLQVPIKTLFDSLQQSFSALKGRRLSMLLRLSFFRMPFPNRLNARPEVSCFLTVLPKS